VRIGTVCRRTQRRQCQRRHVVGQIVNLTPPSPLHTDNENYVSASDEKNP
jgi:hypothetical protein